MWRPPSTGAFDFVVEVVMTEPVLDEVGLLAAIDALRGVSPEEQEAAILALDVGTSWCWG
jgi:hypothetical protein